MQAGKHKSPRRYRAGSAIVVPIDPAFDLTPWIEPAPVFGERMQAVPLENGRWDARRLIDHAPSKRGTAAVSPEALRAPPRRKHPLETNGPLPGWPDAATADEAATRWKRARKSWTIRAETATQALAVRVIDRSAIVVPIAVPRERVCLLCRIVRPLSEFESEQRAPGSHSVCNVCALSPRLRTLRDFGDTAAPLPPEAKEWMAYGTPRVVT